MIVRKIVTLLAAWCVVPLALCAQTDDETWAQLVLDHPLDRAGDADRVVASWVDMIVDEPEHALVEGTLVLLRERLDALQEPSLLPGHMATLDGVKDLMTPAARRRLEQLSAVVTTRFAPAEDLGRDLFPDFLAHWWVLGPLHPVADPRFAGREPLLTAEPDADLVVHGPEGDVRWTEVERRPTRAAAGLSEAVFPGHGWLVAVAEFDVEGGGPAWLEFDVGDQLSSSSITPPVWAWSLDGEAPVVEDEALPPRSHVLHRGVVLRDGRNRLALHLHVDSGVAPAVRVLDTNGLPHTGLREARDLRPLGSLTFGGSSLSPVVNEGSIEHLQRQDERSPDADALLGVLLVEDGRPPEGLAHLRAAVEAVPTSAGLTMWLSRLTEQAGYLPDTWRRTRARSLLERAHELDPKRLDAGLSLAALLRREDREQEAVELLRQLTAAHPRQVDSLLALAGLSSGLRMEAAADEARAEAFVRAPECPRVLEALAARDASVGRRSRAFERRLASLRSGGATSSALARLADDARDLGRPELAIALLDESEWREGRQGESLALASLLGDLDRTDEALQIVARVTRRHPRWSWPSVVEADLMRERGDAAGEEAALLRAQASSPGWRVVRDRLADFGHRDVARELFARYGIARDDVLRDDDGAGRVDSVVRLLDAAVIVIFENGVIDFLTHEIDQARDLQGCESLGTQRPAGDVLSLAVIDADGTLHEPVEVEGEYVLSSLEPGDYVESLTRSIWNAPWDGVVRPGSWTFASQDMPFLRSRYVVAVPRAVPLRIVEENFDGTHEVFDEGDFVVHVWETRDRARIVPEPLQPPREWFLPWVELGVERDLEASLEGLRRQTLALATVTPEIEQAALAAIADGGGGDEQRARLLHAAVQDALDQRSPQWGMSATASLLAREGNPCFLYAALLEAADVPHALVWTRGVEPAADPEPSPAFPEADRVRGDLLVRVDPRDGESVLCDLSSRTMPYGVWKQDAPGAEAFVVTARGSERTSLPDVPPEERPGISLEVTLTLDAQGGADVQLSASLTGGFGHLVKEQVREVPKMAWTLVANQLAGMVLPGVSLDDVQLVGLDDERPVSAEAHGRITRFLDDDDGELVAPLPFPAFELSAGLAGEGTRRLPVFLPSTGLSTLRFGATIVLPDELSLAAVPEGLHLQRDGTRYDLSFEARPDGSLVARRDLLLLPISLPASGHAELLRDARRIDEAERGRLRFLRR